ncbi:conserved hypothetical protein [Lodderomyces elongisporus NRRL YB-4239]|uniref:Uncharacterized protein n=1 Tax=Lodderomyces elongisporus (strain ATCC 11503 / CBS 2605 / JCM 1781 / NBRC 1676 / NRRL YB-4239) TaxID=379508 RepID=A5DS44_LODEL|nr:conserved hypothetical protein [Lodderomyces elongisporus NRRL YB-4239]
MDKPPEPMTRTFDTSTSLCACSSVNFLSKSFPAYFNSSCSFLVLVENDDFATDSTIHSVLFRACFNCCERIRKFFNNILISVKRLKNDDLIEEKEERRKGKERKKKGKGEKKGKKERKRRGRKRKEIVVRECGKLVKIVSYLGVTVRHTLDALCPRFR